MNQPYKIIVHNIDVFESHPESLADPDFIRLLAECMARAHSHHHVESVDLILNQRDHKGWLEFGISWKYTDGGKLFVGALQRCPGAPFEFHS